MKWLLCCELVLCLCVLNGVRSENVTSDADLYDFGNSTKGTSNEPDYRLKQAPDDGGTLSTLYDMSRKFAEAVGPKEPIIDEIIKLMDGSGTPEFPKDFLKIVQMEQGFMACLVIGLILFFGLGIAGTCFCCCRCCCGNCGGKKVQQPKESSSTSRKTYSFLLFVTLVLMMVAVGCGYMSSTAFRNAILNSEETTLYVLDDVRTFFNHTTKELEDLGVGGLKRTTSIIQEKLDDVGRRFGDQLQTLSLEKLENDVKGSANTLNDQLTILKEVKDSIDKDVAVPITGIKKKLTDIQNKLLEIKMECRQPCVSMKDNEVTLPEVDIGELKDLPSDIWTEILKEVNKISKQVQDNTHQPVKDAQKKIDDFVRDFEKGDFQTSIDQVSQVTKDVSGTQRDVKDVYQDIRKYGPQGYYAMAGVVSLVTIPVLLLCLGMFCGCAGHREARHPADRGCLSNCGGCTIITGVYLLFFLTGIPILTTVLLFQVGGHAQSHLCSVVYQKDLKTFDNIFDFLKTKMKMDGDILQGLHPSKTFKKCEEGSTVYEALDLEKVLHLEKELDVSDKLNLKDKLDGIKIDVKLEDISKNTKEIEKFDKTKLQKELKKNLAGQDYEDWIIHLKDQKNKIANQPLKDRLQTQIQQLEHLRDGDMANVMGSKDAISKNLDDVTDLTAKSEKMRKGIDEVLEEVKTKATNLTEDFVKEVEQIIKDFAEDAKYKVKKNVGQCRQIWVIFDVLRHLGCREILDPINAYWFSLGWALFFSIFAIAFGAKLSKHYQRMSDMKRPKWDDDLEPREYVSGTPDRRPCIPLKENDQYYSNQGYHSPPPYGGPPPQYGPQRRY